MNPLDHKHFGYPEEFHYTYMLNLVYKMYLTLLSFVYMPLYEYDYSYFIIDLIVFCFCI